MQRQIILNKFKQSHLIMRYEKLNEIERARLIKQLECVEFDLLDLVVYI